MPLDEGNGGIQITPPVPAGVPFRGFDGREYIIEDYSDFERSFAEGGQVVKADIGHASHIVDKDGFTSEEKGQIVEAALWGRKLDTQDAASRGVWLRNIEWTPFGEKAKPHYRKTSPAYIVDPQKKDGRYVIRGIASVGLVGFMPNLGQLAELNSARRNKKGKAMNVELKKKLGLPEDAEEQDLIQAIDNLVRTTDEAKSQAETRLVELERKVLQQERTLEDRVADLERVRKESMRKEVQYELNNACTGSSPKMTPASARELAEVFGELGVEPLRKYLATLTPTNMGPLQMNSMQMEHDRDIPLSESKKRFFAKNPNISEEDYAESAAYISQIHKKGAI